MRKLYAEIKTKSFSRSEQYKIILELEKHKNLISHLFQVYFYLKDQNYVRANKIIINFMKKDFISHLINSDIKQLELKETNEILVFLLKNVSDKGKKLNYFENFVFYLFQNTSGEFKEILDDEFSIDRGVNYVREKYKSFTYGKPFPFVWLPSIYEKGSKKELSNKILEYSLHKKLSENNYQNLLFFRGLTKFSPSYKDEILNTFKKLLKESNFYPQFVLFQLLDDPDFYRYIKAHVDINLGLVINKKRQLFRSLYQANRARNLSFIYLISIGDFSIDFNEMMSVK